MLLIYFFQCDVRQRGLLWPFCLLNIKQIFLGSSGVRGLNAFLKRSFYDVSENFRGNDLMQRTLWFPIMQSVSVLHSDVDSCRSKRDAYLHFLAYLFSLWGVGGLIPIEIYFCYDCVCVGGSLYVFRPIIKPQCFCSRWGTWRLGVLFGLVLGETGPSLTCRPPPLNVCALPPLEILTWSSGGLGRGGASLCACNTLRMWAGPNGPLWCCRILLFALNRMFDPNELCCTERRSSERAQSVSYPPCPLCCFSWTLNPSSSSSHGGRCSPSLQTPSSLSFC